MDVTVVIPICGDIRLWMPLAEQAQVSAAAQTHAAEKIVIAQGVSVSDARNRGAAKADTSHLIFLDADDELDPGYIEAMQDVPPRTIGRPNTIGVYPDGRVDEPTPQCSIPPTDLRRRNCIVISALVPTAEFRQVGGFAELPALEDWHLWRRLAAIGVGYVDVPEAILRITVRDKSRNAPTGDHHTAYQRVMREAPLP